jgi:lipoprotein-anchoring transpeptidase ErfK/SrfK
MKTLLDHPKLVVPFVGAVTALLLLAAPAAARPSAATYYPRAGVLLTTTLAAHAQPSQSSRVRKVFTQFRSDYAPTILLAVAERRGAAGVRWLKVSTPMRPNGQYGWVRADAVQSQPVYKRIVVDISSRQLSLYDHNKLRYRTRTAVGTLQNPTPTGLFYVQARFHPTNSALGAFAFETSGYAPSLSEWPGGGLVGIHGTSEPQLIGRAVSHGCVRISNAAALRLRALVATGTPITIKQ